MSPSKPSFRATPIFSLLAQDGRRSASSIRSFAQNYRLVHNMSRSFSSSRTHILETEPDEYPLRGLFPCPPPPSYPLPFEDLEANLSLVFNFYQLKLIWNAFISQDKADFFNVKKNRSGNFSGIYTYKFENYYFNYWLDERYVDRGTGYVSSRIYFPNDHFLNWFPRPHRDFESMLSVVSIPTVDSMNWHKQLGWEILDHQDPQFDSVFSPIFDFGEKWMIQKRSIYCLDKDGHSHRSLNTSGEMESDSLSGCATHSSSSSHDMLISETATSKSNNVVFNVFYNIDLLRIDVRILDPGIQHELVLSFMPEDEYFSSGRYQ